MILVRQVGQVMVDCVSANVEQCLAAVAEIRCPMVCAHADCVGILSSTLGRAMGLESGYVARLQFAAGLHDIGKVVLCDHILNKSGSLDANEAHRDAQAFKPWLCHSFSVQ